MEMAEYYGKMKKAELSDFLSRPVLINSTSWTGASTASTITTLKPWHLFFNHAYIKYKLNNYAYIRCKLKLKILINASPFFYGSLLVSYSPMDDIYPISIYSGADTTMKLIQRSQLPHLWIFPQNNQGGELMLPFVYHKDWIQINSTTGATNLQELGTLFYDIYNVLLSANGSLSGSDVVTIQTYAWAEDVDVSGPTVSLALQAGDYFNEESSGPISGPASAIANVASKLEGIPVIGRFASAFRIGGRAVSGIARLFGFTDTPNIKNVDAVYPRHIPDLSTQDISYPVARLTLDPKNELTIDPGTIGADRYDQLSLSYLNQHESLIGTTTWATTDAADTLLMSCPVNPMISYSLSHSVTGSVVVQTPLAIAATVFRYWRGDIIFKFVIVASRFHKGRLRVTFDPAGDSTNNVFTVVNTSTVTYTEIVDLSDQTEFEVRIPYHQAVPFLQCKNVDSNITPVMRSTPTWSSDVGVFFNGYVTLRVLTALTAPVDTAIANILFFIRGAENVEYGFPRSMEDGLYTISHVEPQAGEFMNSDYKLLNNNKPNTEGTLEVDNSSAEIQVCMTGQSANDDLPERYLINFGERILSLRQLIHRKTLVRNFSYYNAGTVVRDLIFIIHKHPSLFQYSTNAIQQIRNHANTLDKNCVMAPFNVLGFIAPCFLGYRGSINYYVFPGAMIDSGANLSCFSMTNVNKSIAHENVTNNSYSTTDLSNKVSYERALTISSGAGTAVQLVQMTGSIAVNAPCMTNYKFKFTDPDGLVDFNTRDGSVFDSVALRCQTYRSVSADVYASAGPDYNLFFFRCAPALYYFATPTASTTSY